METEGSLPSSQEQDPGPYPEPHTGKYSTDIKLHN